MAVRTETYILNNKEFIRTWSDTNRYVVRDGISYEEANDPSEFGRTYTEGDIMEESESEAEDILNIIMGDEA